MRHRYAGGLVAASLGLLLVVACAGPTPTATPTPLPTATPTPTPDIRPTVEAVMKASLDDIRRDLALLKSELVKLGGRLDRPEVTKGQVAALESSLSKISEQITKLEGDATVTKSDLDKTKADLDIVGRALVELMQTLENPPSGAAIVTYAVLASKPGDYCWPSGYAGWGEPTPTPLPRPTNSFYVQYVIAGQKAVGLCYHPASLCAQEVRIGLPLPRSCGG